MYPSASVLRDTDAEQCVQDKTAATVNKIYDNVIALPAEFMDIFDIMESMMVNQVSVCLLDGLATPLGDRLADLVPIIEDLQDKLADIMSTIRDGISNARSALESADDGYEQLKAPPPPGDWGIWHSKSGEPYPKDTVVSLQRWPNAKVV